MRTRQHITGKLSVKTHKPVGADDSVRPAVRRQIIEIFRRLRVHSPLQSSKYVHTDSPWISEKKSRVQRADRVVRPYRNCTRISAGEAVQRQAE